MNINLSPEEEEIIREIEQLESAPPPSIPQKEDAPEKENTDSPELIELLSVLDKPKAQKSQEVQAVEEMLRSYTRKNDAFQELLGNLTEISKQLHRLEADKEQVVSGINQFHDQAKLYIEQQRSMIEMQNQIQEYLLYYTNVNKLHLELEQSIKGDLQQREYFEGSLQRMMSEITDGIMFFTAKANFHEGAKYLERYKQLKKKLLAATKSHLFRVFNKEFGFTNSSFSNLRFTEVLSLFFPFFIEKRQGSQIRVSQPNPMKLNFLQSVFPQFIPTLYIYGAHGIHIFKFQEKKKSQNLLQDEEFEKFRINDHLKGFFIFLESQLDRDPEVSELYRDAFIEFRTYCRSSIHQHINDQVNKQVVNVQSLAQTLFKIKAQLLEHQDMTEEDQQFLSQFKNKQLKEPGEPIVYQTLLAFIFELFLDECLYSRVFSYSDHQIIESTNQTLLSRICESYYQTIKIFVNKVTSLDTLIKTAEATKTYTLAINYNSLFQISEITFKKLIESDMPQNHYIVQQLNKAFADRQSANKQPYLMKCLKLFQVEFLDKVKLELMHKIIGLCHSEIQDKIYSFNLKEYLRQQGKLLIFKYPPVGHQTPKGYKLQKQEVFPTVERGVVLILKLSEFVEQKVFEQFAGEVVREINNQIKDIADNFELKFDSYLFFIKQLIILTDALVPVGGNFILKESELDFTQTKMMLLQIISGQVRPEIKWIELTSAEKLWTYTTNFFQFIYKGIPKVKQYEIDLKQSLIVQLKNAEFSFVKDMTFVIGKNIIDFLRKYQYLQYIMTSYQDTQKQEELKSQLVTMVSYEQAQKDFEIVVSRETIQKTYHLFVENLFEFTDEMVAKLNNYTDNNVFEKFRPDIEEIISNSVSLLSSFFINVSKHYEGQEYDRFQFKSVEEVNRITMKKIIYI